jgi:hypothetical protein
VTLEPVVVVLNAEDLAYLRSVIADIPPLPFDELKQANGWTDEALLLGRLLWIVAELHRKGTLEVGP